MECENCGTEMSIINGKFETYNYCFCCGNAQEISEIVTQINVAGVAISTTA
jgi:hypothetical protein